MKTITEPCPQCEGTGERTRQCCDIAQDMVRIEHPLNQVDFDDRALGYQGYQVFKCRHCGALWGCRYQRGWMSTGSDDRWAELDPANPVRHY